MSCSLELMATLVVLNTQPQRLSKNYTNTDVCTNTSVYMTVEGLEIFLLNTTHGDTTTAITTITMKGMLLSIQN